MKKLLSDIAILVAVAVVSLVVGLCRAAGLVSRDEGRPCCGEHLPADPLCACLCCYQLRRSARRAAQYGFTSVPVLTAAEERELALRQRRALEAANRGFRVVNGGKRHG